MTSGSTGFREKLCVPGQHLQGGALGRADVALDAREDGAALLGGVDVAGRERRVMPDWTCGWRTTAAAPGWPPWAARRPRACPSARSSLLQLHAVKR